ncbi:CDP-glycerol glycerophosphotransferase family protein [Bacillus kwashiorkori]|uniref:CDP-glycerol glycerophosphotransferase family protein n=1 Tax=Bacillus kwashiorkori TaxID=1522318 RepID=UPI0007864721|nr:CDP-glycerol glycerophosphotransferase family protein [Bacillus kwashiorkori]
MSSLRLLPTIIVKYIIRIVYAVCSFLFPVNSQKITFASYRSEQLKDNLQFIYDEMTENYPQYDCHILIKKFDRRLLAKVYYVFHMIKTCYHLATSKHFIIDDYCFPLYCIKELRPGTETIQLWHSAGALKKFGLSTVGKPFGPSETYIQHIQIHGNYSKVYVSAKEVIPYFAEAFQMNPKQIYPLGIPRTDYFFDKNRIGKMQEQFNIDHPEFAGKKIILYAPTFRGKSHDQACFTLPFDLQKMERALADEYVLLIHLHPYMRKNLQLENNRFAYQMDSKYKIEELLAVTDLLITDYSTVFFDYSLLERPMVFYAYDLDKYIEERDFYYDYEKMIPGPLATDTDSLIEVIKLNRFSKEQITAFKNRFFDYQDGNATKRIVAHILEGEMVKVTRQAV